MVGKLVRDRIPEIVAATGRRANVRQLSHQEYGRALREKLSEEGLELREAMTSADVLEEAADVLEVVRSLAALYGHPWDDVVRAADQKRQQRGGFDLRLWLEPPEPSAAP